MSKVLRKISAENLRFLKDCKIAYKELHKKNTDLNKMADRIVLAYSVGRYSRRKINKEVFDTETYKEASSAVLLSNETTAKLQEFIDNRLQIFGEETAYYQAFNAIISGAKLQEVIKIK